MVKTKVDVYNKNPLTTFKCPTCKNIDVLYTKASSFCYRCGHKYAYDVSKIQDIKSERIYHHICGRTSR